MSELPSVEGNPDVRASAAAGELATEGQRALRAELRPGISELDLLAAVKAAVEAVAGEPVEMAVDLLSGPRTELIDGPPTDRIIKAGDPVIFDLAPHRAGRWADSCATLSCGRPGEALAARHAAVFSALEAGFEALAVGATAGSIDGAVRDELARHRLRCPHPTGHAVGVRPHEQPVIEPDEPTRLEPGMVIAIEAGAYDDGFGVRLEHMFLIEPEGPRALTHHSLSLT